jgi:hypothetical protein
MQFRLSFAPSMHPAAARREINFYFVAVEAGNYVNCWTFMQLNLERDEQKVLEIVFCMFLCSIKSF